MKRKVEAWNNRINTAAQNAERIKEAITGNARVQKDGGSELNIYVIAERTPIEAIKVWSDQVELKFRVSTVEAAIELIRTAERVYGGAKA